jgi:uncharacterized delta-60 repeat protein
VELERYNADPNDPNTDGSLDTSFGANGSGKVLMSSDIVPSVDSLVNLVSALAVQPDGYIIIGGGTQDFTGVVQGAGGVFADAPFLARFTPSGSLDSTFGPDHSGTEVIYTADLLNTYFSAPENLVPNIVFLTAANRNDLFYRGFGAAPYQFALTPDGKILTNLVGFNHTLLAQFNSNGSVDTAYLSPQVPVQASGHLISIQGDGKAVLLTGITDPISGNPYSSAIRYNADGSPDLGFGPYGDATAEIIASNANSGANDLALDSNGNIVAVGTIYDPAKNVSIPPPGGIGGWDITLTRLIGQSVRPEGTPITLFPAVPTANQQAESFSYTWSVTKNGAAFASSSSAVLATVPPFTFTPDDNGTYVATLTVTDAAGFSTSASITLDVVDAPPTAVHITQPSITSAGQVNLTATAFGPTLPDQQAGYTYTFNWGDGSAPTVIPPSANNGSGVQPPQPHAYAPGIYTLTVTATEEGGKSASTTALVVVSATAGDNITLSGAGAGQVAVSTTDEGSVATTTAPEQVLVAGAGGSDTYTVNFGSSLTTPIVITGGGSASGDTLVANGDGSATNVINKTPGQITWGNPVTETIFRSGIPNTTINANGTSTNYINDPGGSTTINGGPGANFITITATSGSGVVLNGGPGANTYIVDVGSLAGPVTIQNKNSAATNNLIVNGAAGNNTIAVAGNQVTAGTQTITDTASLANLTVNGGSGNNQLTVSALTVPVKNVTLVGGGGTNTYTVNAGTINIVPGPGVNILNVTGGTVAGITAPAGDRQPLVFAHSYTVLDNGTLNVPANGVLVNDVSANGQALTAVLASGPAHGTLKLNADGSFTYTPAANFVGSDTFTYQARGSDGTLSVAAPVSIQVSYRFSGFLAPLNSNLAMALNRMVPIKFQLSDYKGTYISSLTAITSLQVLNAQGQNVLTNPGSTALRYDSTAKQFVANWQTKGLPAGTYTVTLALADGTTYTKSVQLSITGSSAGLTTVIAGGTGSAPGGLLGGDIDLYVDNSNGDLTADELARIQDAVTAVDAVTEPYGVAVQEVADPNLADVTLNMDTTSAVGGYADGVLGCTTDAGLITIIFGWNFYAGSDPTQIGSGQYDFQTVVTHELGHALGLGHSTDSTSVMYATLNTGAVNRTLTTADLNVPDSDSTGACGLHISTVSLAAQAVLSGSIVGGARTPSNTPLGIPAFSLPATALDRFTSPVADPVATLLPSSGFPGALPAVSLAGGDGGMAFGAALWNTSRAPSLVGSDDGTPALSAAAVSTPLDAAVLDFLFERPLDISEKQWRELAAWFGNTPSGQDATLSERGAEMITTEGLDARELSDQRLNSRVEMEAMVLALAGVCWCYPEEEVESSQRRQQPAG